MNKLKHYIITVLKKIYRFLPLKLETKQKIKNKLSNQFRIVKRMSDFNDQMLMQKRNNTSIDIPLETISPKEEINKKIVVHLHLFYTDLSDEFIGYLNNIPYKFDLLISVQENANIQEIKKQFQKINKVNKVIVKKSKNIGRDFSPMFVLFKNEILQYDYLLHMHTKKSVRTGKEQDGWRNHMLNGVLENPITIQKILSEFEENKEIGLIYPETYYDMPYWAHTWLKNKANCDQIAKKLNILLDDEYIDYSVGSFFWVRVKAIKNFLNLNYTLDDFGKEEGKADGTLAHAIERMIPQVVMSNNYKYLIYDSEQNALRYKGIKNLYQYENQTKEKCLETLMNYEMISFDIFDTLITRKAIFPSVVFDILETYVNEKYNIQGFKQLRINAEYNVRVEKKFLNDCSINEIYDNLSKILKLSKKAKQDIERKEVELELLYITPRKDMLEIYNQLKKANKKIILISDMYLTTDIVEKMLEKCGYTGWNELLISSEVGLRKDNGQIWDYYFDNYVKNHSSIHVGDNEQSDIQQLCDLGKPFYHVMHPLKMYKLTSYYDYVNLYQKQLTIADKVALGLIINKKIYNSPFKKVCSDPIIDSFYDFGYTMIAPIILKYFTFLEKNIKDKKYDKLLFLAREGYYLQKLYKDFCKANNIKEQPNTYFLTSRRSVSVACIKNINDAKELLSNGFEGNMRSLFKNRFGIEDTTIPNKFIKLDSDKNEVCEILEKNFNKYLKNFKEETKTYKKYCEKNFNNKSRVAVIDLGYSGTIQYYLMKLNNIKMDGYYFTLTDNIKPKKLGGNCYGCFDSQKEPNEKNIYLFSMILEAFLTAPYNQLVKFDSKGEPIYKNGELDQELLKKLDEIYEGVHDFIFDMAELIKDNMDLSNEFVCSNFSSLVFSDNVLSEKIRKIFKLENSYSLDATINVFDYLNLVYKK